MFKLKNIKSILYSLVGNIIAWYEYTLYACFATIISDLFFPSIDRYLATLLTFVIFAIGLIARPIGGIVFGHLSDRYGRKKILVLTTAFMSVATLGIGILPTYNEIGMLAPCFLIVLRIAQEFTLGGEFGISCVYLYESVDTDRRGFLGCIAVTGVGVGFILSTCTVLVIEMFVSPNMMRIFAWRIPFFISLIGILVSIRMNRELTETNDFVSEQKTTKAHPFVEMIKCHKLTLFRLFAMYITTQTAFFVVFIFGKTMLVRFLNYSNSKASLFNLIAIVSYTLSTLLFGYLSDTINKRYAIILGSLGILLFSYPFIASFKIGMPSLILFLSVMMGIFIGMTVALGPLTSESFPISIRTTGVAFSCNFTAVVFGGTSPVMTIYLINRYNSVTAVAYYLMATCIVTMVVTISYFISWGRVGSHN